MRAEWLEDLLAIFDGGSLNRAAEARFLTQPAFSRRIGALESYLGLELLDRSRKPAQLLAGVKNQEIKIREIVALTRELVSELKNLDKENRDQVVIASQHAITTSIAPEIVRYITSKMDLNIRLRSANRDECTALMMTGQSDIMLCYRAHFEAAETRSDFVDEIVLGNEPFIPVASTESIAGFREAYKDGRLPIIAYPSNVFMGEVMLREIAPLIDNDVVLIKRAETALTLAALQLANAGIGIAWIPRSLADPDLRAGRLTILGEILPETMFAVTVQRLRKNRSKSELEVWDAIRRFFSDRSTK